MKFSYFAQGKQGFGIATLVRAITGGISTLAPKFSGYLGSKILLRPYGKRHYSHSAITPNNSQSLTTTIGQANIDWYGQGEKVVIVSHGWADSSYSFNHMIKSITEQGYRVAAIDHIGHGRSSGNKAHLPSFIETTEILINHCQQQSIEIKAIIGHSMGAIATLNLPQHLLENKKLILISSPIKFFELMFEKVEQIGISRKLLIAVLERITKQYGKTWQQLQPIEQKGKLALDVTFVHDSKDRYAPFDDLEQFLQAQKNTLITTEGLGHTRILGDTKVIKQITEVLVAAWTKVNAPAWQYCNKA